VGPSRTTRALKSAPDIHAASSGLPPPFVHRVVPSVTPHRVGPQTRRCTAMKWFYHKPQGSSLRSGLCCPGPSSLNRPHPPHAQAHRDFTARRLIRDAFAVRERRGDPRVVPSFRCPFRPDMPSSPTPGSSSSLRFQNFAMTTRSSPHPNRLDTPNVPAIRFTRGSNFVASLVRTCYGLSACSPPCRIKPGYRPGPRRLLRPGFRRISYPPRRWI
jgi:hypothetical protein